MKGALHWSFSLNVQSATQYDASMASVLKADGLAISGSNGIAAATEQVPGGINQFIVGASGVVPYDLDPGESVVFTMVLTSAFTTEPDTGFVVSYPQFTYSGITVPVSSVYAIGAIGTPNLPAFRLDNLPLPSGFMINGK